MPSIKHCLGKLVEAKEMPWQLAEEVAHRSEELFADGYDKVQADKLAVTDLLAELKSELSDVYKQLGVKPVIDNLPDEMRIYSNGPTAKQMREAVSREPYRQVLEKFIAESENIEKVDEARDVLRSKDAKRIMKLAQRIEAENEAYAEQMQDAQREVAGETRVVARNRGTEIRQAAVTDSQNNPIVDDFGNTVTEEAKHQNVDINVYRDDPTELDEMVDTSHPDSTANRDVKTGLDRDELGQDIPERDITPVVGQKQIKFIKDLLTKGVPGFVSSVKAMTEQQRHKVRAAVRELLKTNQLEGDLKTRAEAALKALRGVAEKPVAKQEVEESAEASIDKHYRSLIKTELPEQNTPIWALFKDDGDGNPTNFVGYSTNYDAASYVAETDDLVLVNDMSASLKRSTKNNELFDAQNARARQKNYDEYNYDPELGDDPYGRWPTQDEMDQIDAEVKREKEHTFEGEFTRVENNAMSPSKTMEMNYRDGYPYGHKMRPEFAGRSTLGLIKEGLRTATTRKQRPNVKVGDIIRFENKGGASVLVRVTKAPYKASDITAEEWSKLEGWAPKVHAMYLDSWQFQYELVNGGKNSNQSPVTKTELPSDKEQTALVDRVVKLLGEQVRDKVKLVKDLRDGMTLISGQVQFDKDGALQLMQIAMNAEDINGVADHESFHQLFSWLHKNGSTETIALIERLSGNGILRKRLEELLQDHPNAVKQLADPEEFAAYLFQFWRAGRIKLGPQYQGFFQKAWNLARGLLQQMRLISSENTDLQDIEGLFAGFAAGEFAKDKRDEVIQSLEKRYAEARRNNSKAFWQDTKIHAALRKGVYTAQGTLNDFNNQHLKELGEWFNTGVGDRLTRQGFLEAKAQKAAEHLNRLTNLFDGVDPSDLALLKDGLLKRERPKDAVAGRLFDKVQDHLRTMRQYLKDSGVQRFDHETHQWVDMGTINDNYFPRVFDAQKIASQQDAFVAKLLELHPNQLALIAEQANKELATKEGLVKGSASHEAVKNKSGKPITAEDVAKAITARIINGMGDIELDESTSALGMTPLMRSVNRRQLTWLDDAGFAEFMSQDAVGTLVGYTMQAVKRAEYVKRFGNDGVKLREQMDKALIEELGGMKLVKWAEGALPEKIKEWKKEYAKQARAGINREDRISEPTLLSVALEELRAEAALRLNPDKRAIVPASEQKEWLAAQEKAQTKAYGEVLDKEVAARVRLQPAAQAVMALEGTLGYNINPNIRRLAGAVMTYQNWRLLITGLFGSMVDPLGIIVRGGEMQDAWNAFARGLREIGKGWKGEKSNDELTQLAEMLGTVDAGTFLDALGQTYSSLFMYGKLKQLNDKLFRINGLEAWNRAMRIQATGAAVSFIKKHLNNPMKDSKRYLQDELGLDPADKDLLTADGELNFTRDDVKQAIMRWVDTSIVRPNAAMRPVWASDPHYAVFYHLKSFAYAFHKTILERVVNEAKHDNFVPALYLLSIYTPVMIAADAAKELLIPGDDDPLWMKSGVGGAIKHGTNRANLTTSGGLPIPGIPGLYADGADELDFFGPAVDQVKDFVLLPFNDKKLGRELAGALPFGNVARKYVN